MNNDTGSLNVRPRRVVPYRGRGPIYNWLRAQHEIIAPMFEDGTATWPAVCREMARHGVLSREGRVPSTRAASKAWQVVVRDVADDTRRKADDAAGRIGGTPPSHRPKHGRPGEPTSASMNTALVPAGNRAVAAVSPFRAPVPMAVYSGASSTHAEKMALLNGEATVVPVVNPNADAVIQDLLGRLNVMSGLPWDYRKEEK
jgi:hypothetical protein